MKKDFAEIEANTKEVYEKNAKVFDQRRGRSLFEKAWLDRFIEEIPRSGSVLDLGCGAGEPIAKYLISNSLDLTGVDFSSAMIEIIKSRFPHNIFYQQDMRKLDLGKQFDGIIAWDSFFHLNHGDQELALKKMAQHLKESGALLITVGHGFGEVLGQVGDDPVYHSSFSKVQYAEILGKLDIDIIDLVIKDANCGERSVLFAKKRDSKNR